MKAIFSLKRHSYLKTVGVFLIAVALIAGIVGCEGEPTPEFNLTTAVNPAGTGTATDQTGTSPYEEDTVVDIEAVAADCYRFVNWAAPAGTFGAANNATTTFTMPASDVTVTANFEEVPPDHYKFYSTNEGAPYIGEVVQLEDQFGTFNATVGYAISFGNPVEKVHPVDVVTPIEDENRHYTLYELDYGEGMPMLDSWEVMVNNQFQDDVVLTVVGPLYLAVPTQKEDHETPKCIDHLLVYDVIDESFPEVGVRLTDQFIDEDVTVWEPIYFANPAHKTAPGAAAPTPIEHEDEHYVFYAIEDIGHEPIDKIIQIDNQFGPQTLDLTYRDTLAVPSQKIDWWQTLDHFKVYWATWGEEPPPTFPAEVQLEDQFITEWLGEPLIALVGEPVHFANPVNKLHGMEVTPISDWDNHYTFYDLMYEAVTPLWYVEVSNQFDPWEAYQEVWVSGPEYLAVPTKKGPHDPPVNLDHFLVYEVLLEPPPAGFWAPVYLWDQFTDYEAVVYAAAYFANPVKKTDATGVTDIMYPDDHLLFYWIDGFYFPTIDDLPIDNQFGPQFLNVWPDEYDLLGVPSQKIAFSIYVPD
jgi:hypothetical protein